MTPAQLEHLRKIDAHLEKLLSQAEKRTPGRWVAHFNTIATSKGWWGVASTSSHECVGHEDCPMIPDEEKQSNATFIASCAGNAEAGWKAARAAIKWLIDGPAFTESENWLLESILAAFPLEIIEG